MEAACASEMSAADHPSTKSTLIIDNFVGLRELILDKYWFVK
jgi:hypothetical protein